MVDPVRDLNNFLQGQPGGNGGNATKDFQWILTREGPERCPTYHVTAAFRGVNVGVGHGSTEGIAKRDASIQALEYLKTQIPYDTHPQLTMTMNRPGSVLQHADRLMQSAEVLFRDKQSMMMIDDRNLVEDHMDCARDFREGIEKKSCIAKAKQANLYFERAQKALDAVKEAIEKCG